ncbi:HlyD family type I secretion periplasmic adaptor subunit [Bradyrhizobium elkanii]|uniref:Membrane fusion protein (MFP) family protein n=1 Tax=Bradyrhizobium elkanii TaxID=29448 RepID=A0A4U6S150_BRAEL|nr:HlyD family type I secretion periplasmic adaptor subunit [Bradyrhizobium elkanii]TKV80751.1 HlyD family type I secretion periplasmic adaptor subunit [Bradyrhizobium elkanii]
MKSVREALPVGGKSRDELAFLPAALEIVETPPSPTARLTGVLIAALFCCAVAWAGLGKIDIVASASGKIVPGDRVKLVQPLEIGVVRAIHVRDGQTVKAGEVLIELDPTSNQAELQHLKNDLLSSLLDISRTRSALDGNTSALDGAPDDTPPALIKMHLEFLRSQDSEQRAKLSELDRQRVQKVAETRTIEAGIAKIDALLPVLQERVGVRKYLADREYGSKLQYLSELQELVGLQQDILVQRSKLEEANAAVAALDETRAKLVSEYRHRLYDDLAKATQKAGSLKDEVAKAEHRTNLQKLAAPIDGVVQQLAVHTVGGVVTPAQTLAVVVPSDNQIEIEAMVSNRDIGFVHPGQDAEIKVDTFNFTRYGLLHGRIVSVSRDSVSRDRSRDPTRETNGGGTEESSEPKGQAPAYIAHVSIDRTKMIIDDKEISLSPGMAVTVQIRTGARSVMSYLLSPIMRYRQDALRER